VENFYILIMGANFNQTSDKPATLGALVLDFGDGSDGDVTISGDTNLTRTMYYNDLTIDSGFTLSTKNFKVYVKGTLTNNGNISGKGNDGTAGVTDTGGSGGLSSQDGFFRKVRDAGDGDWTFNGDGGSGIPAVLNALVETMGGASGAGGAGGDSPNYTGGTSQSASTAAYHPVFHLAHDFLLNGTPYFGGASAPGGAGGAGDLTNAGGAGGGGGGAGGGGGWIYIITQSLTDSGSITVAGGTGGALGLGVGSGNNGTAGGNGGNGKYILANTVTQTITVT
jgi:hypothetical protein